MELLHNEVIAGVYLSGPPQRSYGGMSLENPNLPLNDPAIWDAVFGGSYKASTGETITPDKAMMYAPFWHAVNMISSDVAALPLELYKRRPDIGPKAREVAEDDDLHNMVGRLANENTSAYDFWANIMSDALIFNNGYALIVRDGSGEPVELVNLLPDRTTQEIIDGRVYYITEVNGGYGPKLTPFLPEDVLHIRGFPIRSSTACAVFSMARNSIGLGLAQEGFASAFFRHGGRIGGVLELPLAMSKMARDTVEEGFRKTYEGADNPFKTVVLRDNAKFHAAQSNPQESQLVEATAQQTRAIAHWFLLPPSKLGLSDSVSYNSKSEDNQAYYDQCLKFWTYRVKSACNHKLLPHGDKRYFDFDTTELFRMNMTAMATVFQTLITARVMNPNECRQWLDLLPYEGGDEFVNPNTMKSGAPDSPDAEDPPEDEPAEIEQPAEDPPKRSAAASRVLFGITARARDKAKRPKAFIEWIDGGLSPHRDEWRASKEPGPFPFDPLLIAFKATVAKVTDSDLPIAVDAICQTFEEQ